MEAQKATADRLSRAVKEARVKSVHSGVYRSSDNDEQNEVF